MNTCAFWSFYWGAHAASMAGLAVATTLAAAGFVPPVATKLLEELSRYGKPLSAARPACSVAKRYFVHFYVVGTCVNSGILWTWGGTLSWLYQIQVSRRLGESLFVTHFSSLARMHVLHYILGISYYIAVPLTLRCIDGNSLAYATWALWLGSGLFLAANWVQFVCHKNLATLRPAQAHAGPVEYTVPHRFWFDLVSCPHYMAEVAAYVALGVVAGGSRPAVLLALFVAIELTLSATIQHAWYHRTFREYPRARRAILPFVL